MATGMAIRYAARPSILSFFILYLGTTEQTTILVSISRAEPCQYGRYATYSLFSVFLIWSLDYRRRWVQASYTLFETRLRYDYLGTVMSAMTKYHVQVAPSSYEPVDGIGVGRVDRIYGWSEVIER